MGHHAFPQEYIGGEDGDKKIQHMFKRQVLLKCDMLPSIWNASVL